MVGPGDQSAAGGGCYGYLRASHADREQVIDQLKAAFVQGRLAKDEFDLRVSRVFASRTYAELNAVSVDLPPGLSTAQLPVPARRESAERPAREAHDRKVVKAWAWAAIALPSMAAGIALLGSGVAIALNLLSVLMFACVVTGPVIGLVMLHSWVENHSGTSTRIGQSAGPDGHPSRGLAVNRPLGRSR